MKYFLSLFLSCLFLTSCIQEQKLAHTLGKTNQYNSDDYKHSQLSFSTTTTLQFEFSPDSTITDPNIIQQIYITCDSDICDDYGYNSINLYEIKEFIETNFDLSVSLYESTTSLGISCYFSEGNHNIYSTTINIDTNTVIPVTCHQEENESSIFIKLLDTSVITIDYFDVGLTKHNLLYGNQTSSSFNSFFGFEYETLVSSLSNFESLELELDISTPYQCSIYDQSGSLMSQNLSLQLPPLQENLYLQIGCEYIAGTETNSINIQMDSAGIGPLFEPNSLFLYLVNPINGLYQILEYSFNTNTDYQVTLATGTEYLFYANFELQNPYEVECDFSDFPLEYEPLTEDIFYNINCSEPSVSNEAEVTISLNFPDPNLSEFPSASDQIILNYSVNSGDSEEIILSNLNMNSIVGPFDLNSIFNFTISSSYLGILCTATNSGQDILLDASKSIEINCIPKNYDLSFALITDMDTSISGANPINIEYTLNSLTQIVTLYSDSPYEVFSVPINSEFHISAINHSDYVCDTNTLSGFVTSDTTIKVTCGNVDLPELTAELINPGVLGGQTTTIRIKDLQTGSIIKIWNLSSTNLISDVFEIASQSNLIVDIISPYGFICQSSMGSNFTMPNDDLNLEISCELDPNQNLAASISIKIDPQMIPGNLIFYPKLEINGSSEYYPLSASQLSHTKHLTIQAIESVDFTISFAASPQNYQCYFITPDQGTSNSFSGTINSNQLHQEFIFGCTEINNPVYNFVASIDEDSDDIGNQGIEVSIQFNGETPILRTIYADPGYVQESHVGDSTYTLTIISSPTGFNCSISGYGNLPPTQSRTAIFNTFTVVPIVCESI